MNYEDLTSEEKFKCIFDNWLPNEDKPIRRMIELSEKDNYEDSTLWLAAKYRHGKDVAKAIEIYKKAIKLIEALVEL